MTIADRIAAYPPVLCRLLARHQRRQGSHYLVRAMSPQEIAKASGIKLATVEWLSTLTSWDQVPVATMFSFAAACGVDFNDRHSMRRQADILRKTSGRMAHWKGDTRLNRLVQIWCAIPVAA